MATQKSFKKRLDTRRHKGESLAGAMRSTVWESVHNVKPGYFAKFSRLWNSGYDGPGKGTW